VALLFSRPAIKKETRGRLDMHIMVASCRVAEDNECFVIRVLTERWSANTILRKVSVCRATIGSNGSNGSAYG
jgi:hypothetical protein